MTDNDSVRDEMLRRIRDEQEAWRAVVAEVGRDRMQEPGPMGEWSFKDLAAHLLGWRERTIAYIEAAAAGRDRPANAWPDDLGDDDAINDWINRQYADRSVDEVLADVDRSFDRLAAGLASLPDARLMDPNAIAGFEGYAPAETDWLSHWHDEHEASVREWLAGRSRAG